jgi:hypothetical protein
MTASNGVVIEIRAGTNSVTVRTDGLQAVGQQTAMFPAEEQSSTKKAKLILLKAYGATIAELRIPKNTPFVATGKEQNYDVFTQRHTAKGNVTLEISRAEGSPVVVEANEIDAL